MLVEDPIQVGSILVVPVHQVFQEQMYTEEHIQDITKDQDTITMVSTSHIQEDLDSSTLLRA